MTKSRRLVALIKNSPRTATQADVYSDDYPVSRLANDPYEKLTQEVVGAGRPVVAVRRSAPPREVAEAAGREQCDRHAAEHEERDRNRRDAGRVHLGRGLGPRVGRRLAARRSGGRRSRRLRRRRGRIVAARSELAAKRGLERAGDDLLRVRVVPQVGRDRVDRLLVAVRLVQAVDASVVEPVREDLVSAYRRHGRRRQGEHNDSAKSEKESRLIGLSRTLRLTGSPYVLPPGTPKDRVEIVQEAMRKTFKDPEFHREYRKVVGDEASPMAPEDLARAIRETPRDPELIELFKIFSGSAPLPAR